MAGDDDTTATSSGNLVSIKVPEFSDSCAIGWFAVLEAQFKLKNITQTQTKFYNALSALPPHFISNNLDIINSEDYDALKTAVIAAFEQTKPELFDKLSKKAVMTGRPSQYLRELQTLAAKAGLGNSEELIKHRFFDALPKTISPSVASQKTLSLQQLGSLADDLMHLHKDICNFTVQDSTNSVNKVSSNNNNSSQGIPFGLRPFHANQRPKICKAHLYYAEKAKSCKPWCRYPDKRNCKIQPSSRSASPSRNSEN